MGRLEAESTTACLYSPLGPKCCCCATKAEVRHVPFSRAVPSASSGRSILSPTDVEEHPETPSFALLPKKTLPEPQSKATCTDLPSRGKLWPEERSSASQREARPTPTFISCAPSWKCPPKRLPNSPSPCQKGCGPPHCYWMGRVCFGGPEHGNITERSSSLAHLSARAVFSSLSIST